MRGPSYRKPKTKAQKRADQDWERLKRKAQARKGKATPLSKGSGEWPTDEYLKSTGLEWGDAPMTDKHLRALGLRPRRKRRRKDA